MNLKLELHINEGAKKGIVISFLFFFGKRNEPIKRLNKRREPIPYTNTMKPSFNTIRRTTKNVEANR